MCVHKKENKEIKMGVSQSKVKKHEEDFKRKLRHQQEKINELMYMRESESQVYEKEIMGFVVKEVEWKRERKRLRDEVKKLRKKYEERNDNDDEKISNGFSFNVDDNYLIKQMKEERAWQDEAVVKWKKLYLAIKVELDDLITRTHDQGERMWWKNEEEELMEEVLTEIKEKEETIETLKARLALMEKQECRWQSEVDILRQSLKIVTHNNTSKNTKLNHATLHFKRNHATLH